MALTLRVGKGGAVMERLRWAAVAAVLGSWVVIGLAMEANPGYYPWRGPLSQLGSPGAHRPWIYNGGMMLIGLLIVLYALHAAAVARHWLEGFGSGFFGVAGIFLALVGVYHGGTPPHDFVSLWFFVQAALAAVVWGLGELAQGRARGWAFLALGAGAPLVAHLVPWPANGLEECFGAAAVDAFALLIFAERRLPGGGPAPWASGRSWRVP